MKYRIPILFFIVGVLALLLLWFLYTGRIASVARAKGRTVSSKQNKSTFPKQDKKTDRQSKDDAANQNEIIRKTLSTSNHQPIEFYGKAVDQYGKPVVDAEVMGNVQVFYEHNEREEKHPTKTDLNGDFHLGGFKGQNMGVSIQKPGYDQYVKPGANTYFIYSLMWKEEKRHKPDPNHPVIFPMWRQTGPEWLIQYHKNNYIPFDGSPAEIKLLTGEKVDHGGDLRVRVRGAPNAANLSTAFDWTTKIEMINGGFLECADQFPYFAPESGYKSVIDVNMPMTSTNWSSEFTGNFYVKLQDGKYGRMNLKVSPIYGLNGIPPMGGFHFDIWLNPTGSRNLEIDPEKYISMRFIEEYGLEEALRIARRVEAP